jgi:hypothetical protein
MHVFILVERGESPQHGLQQLFEVGMVLEVESSSPILVVLRELALLGR